MDFAALKETYPQLKNLDDQEIAVLLVENNMHGLSAGEFKKRFGMKLPFDVPQKPEVNTGLDIIKGAASGVPSFGKNISTVPQKALLGLGYLTGLAPESVLRTAVPYVKAQEDWWNKNTGAGFEPETRAGRFAKGVTESAIPIPGLGPVGLQMKLGAASGAVSELMGELGFGTAGQVLGSVGPFAAYALKKSFAPTSGYKRLGEAWKDMTPEQRSITMTRLETAKRHGIPLDVWQAAPEGSSLNELGKAVAMTESGKNIQANIAKQGSVVGGKGDLFGQRKLTEVGEKLIGPYKTLPVSAEDLRNFHDSIMGVKDKRFARGSGDVAEQVNEQAGKFGRMEQVQRDPAEVLNELLVKRDSLPKGSPEREVVAAEVNQWLKTQGKGQQALTEPQFVPAEDIKNVGNVLDVRSELDKTRRAATTGLLPPTAGTAKQMRGALNEVLYGKVPALAPVMGEYDTVRDIIKSLESSQKIAGRHSAAGMQGEAGTEFLHEAALGAARTPRFMLLNPARRATTMNIGKVADKALGQNSIDELIRTVSKNPKELAAKMWLASLLQPAKNEGYSWPEGLPLLYSDQEDK